MGATRMPDTDAAARAEEIAQRGAASVPALDERMRANMLNESSTLSFSGASGAVGPYGVRQEMSVCRDIPEDGVIRKAAEELRHYLSPLLGAGGSACNPPTAFRFNELVLQRYPAGSRGITPHRDGKRYRCLVAIAVISGSGTFAVCRDRSGAEPHSVDARPGRVVLLRAPGFRGIEARPYHFVSDVSEERTVLTLRFDSSSKQ